MAVIQIKRGAQSTVSNLVLAPGELAVALDTGNVYVGATSGNVHINPAGGTADTAKKLQTSRSFSAAGDAEADAVSFDGTQNVQLQLVLATIASLTPGTYTKVTVDKKGRVTAGQSIEISDLPSIPSSKITGLGTAAAVNTGTDQGNVPVVQADGKLLASLIPSLSGTYVPVSRTINGKPLSANVTLSATDVGAIPASKLGAASGVAELDSSGKVPADQLPSYVDDVLEYDSKTAFPGTGEAGKIYVAADTNLTYRWSGSAYVEISKSLALGETSSTAYRGDRGKAAYDHSQATGNPHGTTPAQIGAAEADHTHSGSDITGLTASRALVADGSGKVAVSAVTATELGYLDGVTSAIQTQLNAKAPSSHTSTMATASKAGHVKAGAEFSVGSDGTLSLISVDGGTF